MSPQAEDLLPEDVDRGRGALPPRTQRAQLPKAGQTFYDWCEAQLKLAAKLQQCAPLRAEAETLRRQESALAAQHGAAEGALAAARAQAHAEAVALQTLRTEVAMGEAGHAQNGLQTRIQMPAD